MNDTRATLRIKSDKSAAKLSDDQLELLQNFINDSPPGEYEAMHLIPEGYLEYFPAPQTHGQYFKAAVEQRRLANIRLGRFDMGSKHWWYNVHE